MKRKPERDYGSYCPDTLWGTVKLIFRDYWWYLLATFLMGLLGGMAMNILLHAA